MQWSPLRKVRGAQLLKEMVKPENDAEEAEDESWSIFVGISRDFRLVSFWHFLFALRCTDLDGGLWFWAQGLLCKDGDGGQSVKLWKMALRSIEANRSHLRPSCRARISKIAPQCASNMLASHQCLKLGLKYNTKDVEQAVSTTPPPTDVAHT